MTFNEGMQIDPNRASSGGGPGMGGKLALGGGAGGLIVLVLTLLLGGDPGSVLGQFTGTQDVQSQPTAGTPEHCRTAADANRYVDCRVVLTAQSLDAVWSVELPKQAGVDYVEPKLVLFSGSVSTGCGNATSAVGPFYCPADQTAYFDVSFFQELVDRFGSSGGPLAQEYVVAHEFGHHIQNLLGDIGRAQRDPRGPESGAVRTELQADCYAGIWAHFADKMPAPGGDGRPFLQKLSDTDIADALSAASAVGDDRIQRAAQGRVNPEAWTHGSSEQRQKWFLAGYQTGSMRACDTYSARDLDNPTAR
ncbi:neutral zinc metallopeptidase [Nocardia cyriacigeorgica]|uniref:KPN_02809 family neutral zinc metallopeptidase n=1 Tax=Nocardia cyriacigeorgica TaxID=135487 RepID=UPI001892EF57|nr:neutral zinc metallopeptidase [Nocardia cyriacigeorgica]MBF6316798.1 neutral zinc metallopeptidase [Nocardia cyriacigeorgica]MBF6345739.1 neutral zinc metallopeptidase [Nocardia cyriacigeorgica]MBF6513778.1 neutral zinc metallopeptidase [Nocardia cyriacigeorgica]MBF6535561.1 neutral zinc metallopeptidase [Nocardia cyriacigeorgica]